MCLFFLSIFVFAQPEYKTNQMINHPSIISINVFSLTNLCKRMTLKGYLRYKMITFQNVSSEAQVRIFLFHRKVMFRSQDVIPWFTKSGMSWWVLVYTWDMVHFWIYFLRNNTLTLRLGQMIAISKSNIFLKSLNNLKDWGYASGPFQFSKLLQLYTQWPVMSNF